VAQGRIDTPVGSSSHVDSGLLCGWITVCRVLEILDPSTMKPFTVRDRGDTLVVEIGDIVLVLNRRLEKPI
jgi:hypothetical protein